MIIKKVWCERDLTEWHEKRGLRAIELKDQREAEDQLQELCLPLSDEHFCKKSFRCLLSFL